MLALPLQVIILVLRSERVARTSSSHMARTLPKEDSIATRQTQASTRILGLKKTQGGSRSRIRKLGTRSVRMILEVDQDKVVLLGRGRMMC